MNSTKRLRTRRHGFTILEVLVVSSIFLVAMGMILPFFLSMLDIYGLSTGKLNVNSDLRQFSSQITRDCSRAATIVPISPDQIRLNYRNGESVTYTRTGGTSFGVIQRADSATGRTTTIADRVRPINGSTSFFSLHNTNSCLLVRGNFASLARSRLAREASDRFEIVVTRRG